MWAERKNSYLCIGIPAVPYVLNVIATGYEPNASRCYHRGSIPPGRLQSRPLTLF